MSVQDDRPRFFLISHDAGDTVAKLAGEIDLATAPPLLEELVAFAQRSSDDRLVIDCSDLEFIDSTGLSALTAARKKTGKTIVLQGLSAQCRRVFEITGLDQVFELVD
jgi:anti-anti-sigma factor